MRSEGLLEQRYRRILRLLPPAYRRAWEDDMVAVFLATMHTDDPDDAEYLADYGRPPWPEVASVAWLAVRLRIGTAGAPPRYLAWGAALRLAVLCGFLAYSALAVVQVGFQLWLSGRLPFLPAAPVEWVDGAPGGRWRAVLDAGALVWPAAFVVLLRGHWRAARAIATVPVGLAIVGALASTASAITGPGEPFLVTVWSGVVLDVLLVLALAAFEVEPAPRRWSWLAALPVAAAVAGALLLPESATAVPVLFDWAGLWCLAVVAGAVVHGLSGRRGSRRRSPEWTHALALLAGVVLVLRLLTLVDYATRPGWTGWAGPGGVVLGLAQAAAVLAVLVPLRRRTRDRLRRLPAAPPAGSASWSSTVPS